MHTLAIIRCSRTTCTVHILCMPLTIMLPNRLCRLDMTAWVRSYDCLGRLLSWCRYARTPTAAQPPPVPTLAAAQRSAAALAATIKTATPRDPR